MARAVSAVAVSVELAQHGLHLDQQSAETHRLGELRTWIVEHLACDLGVARLARQVGMGRRNL